MAHAVVPGSFDPVTNGHVDIIHRSAVLFERITVAVAANSQKSPLFTVDERVDMLRMAAGQFDNVDVQVFEGLLVDCALRLGASVIVRGLRAVSDFEYELQMAHMNRRQSPEVETLFMMTGTEYSYLSSSIVKEIARLGGSVEGLVPSHVLERLTIKFGNLTDSATKTATPGENQ